MNTNDMMYFVTKLERELDRDVTRMTKQCKQRRALHHDNHKKVREIPNQRRAK